MLRDRGRIRRRLALQFHRRLNQRFGSERIADAPAGHGEGFRHRADNDDVVLGARDAGDRVRLVRIIGKVRVAFVAHQPDVVLVAGSQDALVFVGRNHTAGWIIGRAENDHACFRRDGLLDYGCFGAEAIFRSALHVNRCAPCVFHDIGIAHPVGSRDDDFVALLNEHADHVEDRVFTANVDNAFFRFVI
jgi:hypothetical protein